MHILLHEEQGSKTHIPTFKTVSLVNSATCFPEACFSTYLKFLSSHIEKRNIKQFTYLNGMLGKITT